MLSISLLILGSIFGSFLNVCIHRLPNDLDIVFKKSFCIKCKKLIKFYHNIPILSYIFLKGKCSKCHSKINFSYPFVEITTAIIFLTSFKIYGISIEFIFFIIFSCSLLLIFFTDYKEFLILDKITLPVGYFGIFISFLEINPFFRICMWSRLENCGSNNINFLDSAIGGVVGYLLIYFVRMIYLKMRGVEGMGLGDAKLFFLIGAWFGYQSILPILVISSFLGSFFGIFAALKKSNWKNFKKTINQAGQIQLPYGCFIVIATLLYPVVGPLFNNLIY